MSKDTSNLTLVIVPHQLDSLELGAMSRGWHIASLIGCTQSSEVSYSQSRKPEFLLANASLYLFF